MAPAELLALLPTLNELSQNEHANIFVGVNPRPESGAGKKEDIQIVRSVWADLDDISVEEAVARFRAAHLSEPSIVVNSGHSIHAYWLLETPYRIDTVDDRDTFERMLQSLYGELGSDATQDVSRLLRLPGFSNLKDARNGRPAVACSRVSCEPNRRYPLDVFSRWMRPATPVGHRTAGTGERTAELDVSGRAELLGKVPEAKRLVGRLKKPAADRSRRDFSIVCDLVRLKLSDEEIWLLVHDKSKFHESGRPYFDTTIANARRQLAE